MILMELQQDINALTVQRDEVTRQLREQGWTLADLAAQLGVSPQRVWQRLQQ